MFKIYPIVCISSFVISVLVLNWYLYSFIEYSKQQNKDSCSHYDDSCMQLLLESLELENTFYELRLQVDTGAVKNCLRGVDLNNQCYSSVTVSSSCLVITIDIHTEEEAQEIELTECYLNYTKCNRGVPNKEGSVLMSITKRNMSVDMYKNHSIFYFNISNIFSILSNCDSLEGNTSLPPYVLKVRNILRRSFTVAAIVILAVTLLIYALVPSLRRGYGKAIMSYAAAQFSKHFFLGLLKICIPETTSSFIVHSIMEAKYFSDLSSHAWQIIIAYQIWSGFKSRRLPYARNSKEFFVHSVLAWGLCLLVVLVGAVVILLIHRSPLEDMSSKSRDYVLLKVVAIAPLLLAEGASTVFCAATLYRILVERRANKWAWRSELQRHNSVDVRWSSVFIKISFITGVNCIFVTTLRLLDNAYLFSNRSNIFPIFIIRTLKDIYNVRGVEIFFIFVLKQKTWDLLKKRLFSEERVRSNKITPSKSNFSTSNL